MFPLRSATHSTSVKSVISVHGTGDDMWDRGTVANMISFLDDFLVRLAGYTP